MTQSSNVLIEPMLAGDWPEVCAIYLEGISTGDATFETTAPSWESWDDAHLPVCRLVARREGAVSGWAALTPFSKRPVYRGVAEASVYVDGKSRSSGVGSALMRELIERSEAAGIWTLLAKIFPENKASLAIVAKFGFRTVGTLERIGMRNGVWRDVVLLERRSSTAGNT